METVPRGALTLAEFAGLRRGMQWRVMDIPVA